MCWLSARASPRLTAKSGTLYYRFGAPSKIELEYPTKPHGAAREFKHVSYTRSMVSRTEVTFEIGNYSYGVIDYYEEDMGKPMRMQGVRITLGGNNPVEIVRDCKGKVTSKLHQLEGKVPCDDESALGQCKKTSP